MDGIFRWVVVDLDGHLDMSTALCEQHYEDRSIRKAAADRAESFWYWKKVEREWQCVANKI